MIRTPEPDCARCAHGMRQQTGPNEWSHHCELEHPAFPVAENCPRYQYGPRSQHSPGLGLALDPEDWQEPPF